MTPTYKFGHTLPFLVSNDTEETIFRPIARRTPSSPSHSSDSSEHNMTFSPITSPDLKFQGRIPFSWEEIPGIPKNQHSKKKEYSGRHLLPLPPAGNTNSPAKKLHNNKQVVISAPNKYKTSNRYQNDPFFAALVECSKDDRHDDDGTNFGNILKGNKVSRGVLSDRFGFINMYTTSATSCKRTCTAVSESIVFLPRPHYQLLNRRN